MSSSPPRSVRESLLTARRVFTYIYIPETKGVPIECMEALFSGKMRNAAWRSKKLFPPEGIPPLSAELAAGQAAYIKAHTNAADSHDMGSDSKMEREEIESV